MAETGLQQTLKSEWMGLSEHLIASFYEVDSKGVIVKDSAIVQAPLTESSLDATLNWQSPFENDGAEAMRPTLFALLQSGSVQPAAEALGKAASAIGDKLGVSTPKFDPSTFFKQFEGRTGMTKLNSVQVFSGMPPVKIQVTALFRAWRDPVSEVEDPVNQLMAWALPKKLAENSTLFSRGVDSITSLVGGGDMNALDTLLPSESPTYIALKYKGKTFAPLVIESISYPLNSPIDNHGSFVELMIPMTLCTLTALDQNDWKNLTP